MTKLNFVQGFILLAALSFSYSLSWGESEMIDSIRRIDQAWATVHYDTNKSAQYRESRFRKLLQETELVVRSNPNHAEPLIIEGLILSSLAGVAGIFEKPALLNEARNKLETALYIDSNALNASAQITLGALYHCTPEIWFGDDNQAQHLFEDAVRLQPSALDANFYLGAFWLEKEQFNKAIPFLKTAVAAIPSEAELAQDIEKRHLAKEATLLLTAATMAHSTEYRMCHSP